MCLMIASSHVCVLFFTLDDRLETTVGIHSFVGKDKAKCDKAKCVEIAKFEDYTDAFFRHLLLQSTRRLYKKRLDFCL